MSSLAQLELFEVKFLALKSDDNFQKRFIIEFVILNKKTFQWH